MRGRCERLALVLLGFLIGCGSDNGLNLGRVRGKITYKGEPVGFGDILFYPDDTKGTVGPGASATLKSDGTYVLSTEQPGDGVIVGFHKIAITGLDPEPVRQSVPNPKTNPEEFRKYLEQRSKKGGATASPKAKAASATLPVVARGPNVYRLVTPERLSNPESSGIFVEVKGGSNTLNFEIKESGEVVVGH
jgi:hypothetical protein